LAGTITALIVGLVPQDAEARGFRDRIRQVIVDRVGGDVSPRGDNIAEKLDERGNFTILLTALETAGLAETIANDGPFTVFAPTDEAFLALLDQLGITAEELLASPDLTNILLYHVVSGRERAGELVRDSIAPTLYDNRPVLVTFEDFSAKVNRSTIIDRNVRATNGIIQVIDAVLLPPEIESVDNIVDVLRLDGRFSVLITALETTGLDAALSGNDELTLFAPTDEAFVALLDALGITAEQLLANPDLPSILLYHVVPGSQRALPLLLQRRIDTLQGDPVFIGLSGSGIKVNDANVINPNINAPNGVVHTIDGVLLP
jgi:uncharacterized surface protein with fasciclin (FAS1) repeats